MENRPSANKFHIPDEWGEIQLPDDSGIFMVVGAPDVGKTTFCHYLYQHLCRQRGRIAFLDGDPGQSELGPPTTMTLAISNPDDCAFPPRGNRWRSFVGSVTPRGHMLPLLVGAWRLAQVAKQAGYDTIVYDTSGLIDPKQGGVALKIAKIDLLKPMVVIGIQREMELEPILRPLRRTKRLHLIELNPSSNIEKRQMSERQKHRSEMFQQYFNNARSLTLYWPRYSVIPRPRFIARRLVSFEDREGFSLGIGVVLLNDQNSREVTIYTPFDNLESLDTIRLGSRQLNLETFRDERLFF